MFAPSLRVFTIILQGLWVTLQVSRNIIAGNMGRRSGSVKNAQRSMLFNQIGRLTLKPVEQESTDVTVEPFSPGEFFLFFFFPNLFILRGFKLNIVFWSFYISVHLRVPMFPSLLIFDVLQLCTVFYYIGIHSKKIYLLFEWKVSSHVFRMVFVFCFSLFCFSGLFLYKSGKLCMEYIWSLYALAGILEVDTINTSVCYC